MRTPYLRAADAAYQLRAWWLRHGATEIGQQLRKANLFLALGGVATGPILALNHTLTIRKRSRITTEIGLNKPNSRSGTQHTIRAFRHLQLVIRDRLRYNRNVAENQDPTDNELRELARILGRRGGLKGGKARAAKITPQERSESARKAVQARWAKKRQQEETS